MLTGGFAAPPNLTDRRGTPGGRPCNAFRELSNGIGIYSGGALLTRPLNTGDASGTATWANAYEERLRLEGLTCIALVTSFSAYSRFNRTPTSGCVRPEHIFVAAGSANASDITNGN